MNTLKTILICASDSPALAIESALRLQGAVIERRYANYAAALAEMKPAPIRKIVLITVLGGVADLPLLRKLCENFPEQPVLALSEEATDDGFALEAMRAGVSQLVSLPLTGNDFRHALDRIVHQFGFQAAAGIVIAVSGVTEGCGATTISINLANEIAVRTDRTVVLTETTLRMGRLAINLNVKPKYTTADLLVNISSMDEDGVRQSLTPVKERFKVLPGPYQTLEPVAGTLNDLQRLLGVMRRISDVTVVDMPYTFDETYFGVLSCSDQLVLITEQKVPSVHAMLILQEALRSRGNVAAQHLVINRYSTGFPGATYAEIRKLLKVESLLTIPSDGMGMMTALNNGQPLRDAAPHSPSLGEIDNLVSDVLGEPRVIPSRRSAREVLLQRLGHFIGRE